MMTAWNDFCRRSFQNVRFLTKVILKMSISSPRKLHLILISITMAAKTPQAVLAQRLSALLGFEDGTNEVLEHLVSIESSQVCCQAEAKLSLSTRLSYARLTLSRSLHRLTAIFIGLDRLLVTTLGKK
jgi:hypothetical protein